MEFLIADTFTASLARLTGDEQRAVKTTAFDLQLDPERPGFAFHRLDHARDKRFWSVRVSEDLRIIVHRADGSLLLCYVGHHDKAYAWGERRKLETHPTTGAAQLVEIRETVKDIIVPHYVEAPVEVEVEVPRPPRPKLFAKVTEAALLGYGVPPEWLADVVAATDDTILALVEHLPAEAAEALLELATGGKPEVVKLREAVDPFAHPDALRRFRVMANEAELSAALDAPWDRWTIFLHPSQKEQVERDYNGPARVSGSAGTGKTIVALHRAVFLARQDPDARVLLTTFSDILARALEARLRRLIQSEPRLGERVEVMSIGRVGRRLFTASFGVPELAARDTVAALLAKAVAEANGSAALAKATPGFLMNEWTDVVDAWQLGTWEDYRNVKRLGRKTRLPESQRQALWGVFERVRAGLDEAGLITESQMFWRLADHVSGMKHRPYEHVIVDEAQDMRVAHLRFMAALGADRPNALFFAGDLGQRIFQQPFSWRSLGVDIRGRARTLRVNYRTSHQIRMQADRLLDPTVSDVDGNTEERGTVSVFNGPALAIEAYETEAAEVAAVTRWLKSLADDEGVTPGEMAVFVRSEAQMSRAGAALLASGLPFRILDDKLGTSSTSVTVSPMHLAKGLEFRAVAVMACDDEVIPLQARIESITDTADLEEVYQTERHLLYVACTRARDHLLITSAGPPSEFLADLAGSTDT